jgi:hypothetical protein
VLLSLRANLSSHTSRTKPFSYYDFIARSSGEATPEGAMNFAIVLNIFAPVDELPSNSIEQPSGGRPYLYFQTIARVSHSASSRDALILRPDA